MEKQQLLDTYPYKTREDEFEIRKRSEREYNSFGSFYRNLESQQDSV
jgi:hypothetical protein